MFCLHDDGTIAGEVIEPADKISASECNPASLEEGLNIEHVYEALLMGIRDYFTKMGF